MGDIASPLSLSGATDRGLLPGGHAQEMPFIVRGLRGRARSAFVALPAITGGRCSRKAVASVLSAARDFASESVESSTISDDGRAGSPNCRLTSIVPGGARRQDNIEAARPAATASVTAKDPQPRNTSVHEMPALSSARVAMFRMRQDGDDAARRSGSPARYTKAGGANQPKGPGART